MTTITINRATVEQALEALEIGYEVAKAEVDRYYIAMAGFRPESHAKMDAEVQQIAQSITALRAALAEPVEPVAHNPDPYHLSRILHELAGSASMCWEHVDCAGTFQSTQAAEFVAAAIAEIRQRMNDATPQQPAPEPETCTWWQDGDSDSGTYQTSCGNYFAITDGTPEDNMMRHCCYCGKKLVQELITEDINE